MSDALTPGDVARALGGDDAALARLVSGLSATVRSHCLWALVRRRGRSRQRDLDQEVEDMAQEVFIALFENDGRTLRAWTPERGLPLARFVGVVADRQVASILRTGKRSPWTEDPTEVEILDLQEAVAAGPEAIAMARDFGEAMMDRLRAALSPKGLELFHLLFVEERSVERVCEDLGMTADAIYAWRSRIARLARKIRDDLEAIHVRDGEDVAKSELGP